MKVCSNGPGHKTKMAVMPKTLKNLFLHNQKADDLESWYAALVVGFHFATVFQWCCSIPQGSPGVGRNTFLSSPHLCFMIVFICDLFV